MTGEAKRRRGLRSLWPAGLWLLLCAAAPGSAQPQNPLEPLDTSSPRATVTTFLETMNEAITLYREKGDREGARARAFDAVRCLDLSEVPPTIAEAVGLETALQLKEILDRIPLPSPRHIPDAEAMDKELEGSWSIPDTEIAIAQVSEGPRSGEYLFSPQTVQRSAEYYERVRDLPYRPRSGRGANYAEYELGSGDFLSGWVADLPDWAKARFKGQTVWQWVGLALFLTLGSALTGLLYLAGRRLTASRERLGDYVLPLTLMGMSVLIEVLAREIHLTGGVFTAIALVFAGVFFLGGVRLVAVVLNQIAAMVISTSHLRPQGVDSQLIRLTFRVLTAAVVAALLIVAADQLGLPAYSVLTGVGIGGVAVALAARETLANFLGSLVIMFERPFRVGDWIKVAGQEGNVEDIGFRSARIRTFYNSVVTIPSGELVGTSIDNMGMRRYRRVRTVLQITYDTPSEKIDAFVEGIKELIRTHPTTRKENFHVVFHDFGAHSLDILLYFFIVAPDWGTELVERHEVLLEIVRLAERIGVRFAFPTRTLHLESLPDGKDLVPSALSGEETGRAPR